MDSMKWLDRVAEKKSTLGIPPTPVLIGLGAIVEQGN